MLLIRGKNLILIFLFVFLLLVHTITGDFMYYYLNLFFLSSFLGYILETSLKTFFFPNMNNGILFGPWIPVYGFGAVIVVIVSRIIFHRLHCSKLWKTVILFFSVVILLSLLELLGGVIIEKLFHKVFWDYRDQKFNFGPYISLGMSLLWGVFSIVYVYVILPIEKKITKKIPKWITILALCLIITDAVLTYFLT